MRDYNALINTRDGSLYSLMKQDRYYILELLIECDPPPPIIVREDTIYNVQPARDRVMRIMDSYDRKPVYEINLTEENITTIAVHDRCKTLNQGYEEYKNLVMEYVNS